MTPPLLFCCCRLLHALSICFLSSSLKRSFPMSLPKGVDFFCFPSVLILSEKDSGDSFLCLQTFFEKPTSNTPLGKTGFSPELSPRVENFLAIYFPLLPNKGVCFTPTQKLASMIKHTLLSPLISLFDPPFLSSGQRITCSFPFPHGFTGVQYHVCFLSFYLDPFCVKERTLPPAFFSSCITLLSFFRSTRFWS